MPLNMSSISFTMTKWILTVVFMTSTVLMVLLGVVNFFYGLKFVQEVSGYDRPNGAILIAYGIIAIIYGVAMYIVIKKYNPEVWIEPFVVITIVVLIILMISGIQGVSFGSSNSDYNIAHYLCMLYRAQSDYSLSTLERVHQYYECCGLYGNRTFVPVFNGSVPWSCCPSKEKCLVSDSFKLGCEAPISQFHNSSVYSLGSFWMAVGTVYLVTVFLAFYYQKSLISCTLMYLLVLTGASVIVGPDEPATLLKGPASKATVKGPSGPVIATVEDTGAVESSRISGGAVSSGPESSGAILEPVRVQVVPVVQSVGPLIQPLPIAPALLV